MTDEPLTIDMAAVNRYAGVTLPRAVPQGRREDILIKPMKMMDRPVATTDAEAVRGCNRGADPGLGAANRGLQSSPFASPAAIADDSEQPVPWVFLVAMRGAASAIVPLASTR